MPSFVFCRSIVKFEPILFRQRNRRALRKGELRVIEIRRAKRGSESHHLHQKMKDGFTLCILSGEIGGGSTEAWICLGISVFGRCYDAMASDVLTVCCSLNPTVNTMSISLPSVRDHFSFFS